MTAATAPDTDVFKGLPRRVQIGARTYRIRVTDQSECADLEDSYGMTYHEEFRVALHKDMPAHLATEIVQHEISHCINAVYGVDDESTEEQFVTQHSRGMAELWMRNPRLLNWFVKTVRRARKEATRD
jgi:hypothetical protein